MAEINYDTVFFVGSFLRPKFMKMNFPPTTAQNYPSGSIILSLQSDSVAELHF
jgi:hypothetical protein